MRPTLSLDKLRHARVAATGRGGAFFLTPLFAVIYLGIGQKERAIEALERAYSERSTLLGYLKMDPRFDPLRADPTSITSKSHPPLQINSPSEITNALDDGQLGLLVIER